MQTGLTGHFVFPRIVAAGVLMHLGRPTTDRRPRTGTIVVDTAIPRSTTEASPKTVQPVNNTVAKQPPAKRPADEDDDEDDDDD